MTPLGAWLPDQPDFQNPGSATMLNVVPRTASSYGPAPQLSPVTGSLSARCQGGVYLRDKSANIWGFAGDVSKLYQNTAASTNWIDISKSGGYSTNPDERWSYVQFGERIIATNYTDAIQSFVMNVSTDFADLSADAPKARYIAQVRDFVMVANTSDGTDGAVPQRVWWPAIDDPTNWPAIGSNAAAEVQSDQQDLVGDGGWNMGIVGGLAGADALIFQERAVWRAMYVGSPIIFDFAVMANGVGTPAPGSIVKAENMAYYLANNGFFATDGVNAIPIGAQQVDRTFWSMVDQGNLFRITSAADPLHKLIYWAFPGPGNSEGGPNYIIAYNYEVKRWSLIQQMTEVMIQALTKGYTLDDLTSFGTLDSLPFPLDSRAWTGGQLNLACFDPTHSVSLFSGLPLAATMESSEANLNDKGLAHVSRVWPIVDTDQATITVGRRNRLSDAVTWGVSTPMTATTGSAPCRSTGVYQRARIQIPAGVPWSHGQGVNFDARPAGNR